MERQQFKKFCEKEFELQGFKKKKICSVSIKSQSNF